MGWSKRAASMPASVVYVRVHVPTISEWEVRGTTTMLHGTCGAFHSTVEDDPEGRRRSGAEVEGGGVIVGTQ